MRSARAALAFLTRLPAGALRPEDFARAPAWFAAVGLLIGAIQAAVFLGAAALWTPWIAALMAVIAGLLVTGALHEDGLADMVDGLGSGRPADRALDIMRDSRIGSFGALALVLALGLRVSTLAALGPLAPLGLVAGQAASRGVMALMLRAGPYLRASGAGTGMTGPMGRDGAALWLSFGACGVGLVWALGWGVLGALTGLMLGAGLARMWAMRRLGGLTGDVFGAAQVLGDVGFLLGVLACL